jgi:hypothetical protein
MLLLGAMVFTCCQNDEPQDTRLEKRGRILQLDVSLGLQPDGDMQITRAPGDPGTYENFEFPEHAYVYLILDDGSTQTVAKRTNEDGSDDTLPLSFSLNPNNWRKTTHTQYVPKTFGDNIYVYLDKLYFYIPNTATSARLYVAMSKQALHNLTPTITAGTSTEVDVQSMTFDVVSSSDDAAMQQADRDAIQHIYSSPYNYIIDSRYYGTVDVGSEGARLSLMLYHVAAKVDMMWNIDKTKQVTNRLTYIQARKLKQLGCQLFKPTENTWSSADDDSNYTFDLMDADVSRQWYGRQYYYVIPYMVDSKYAIYLHMLKNGDDKSANENSGYNLTIKRTPTSDIFVPWLRGDLKFTSDIAYDNVEK